MGCDFQIAGFQPDAILRQQCIEFLLKTGWVSIWDNEGLKDEIQSMQLPPYGAQLAGRTGRSLFRLPEEYCERYCSYTDKPVWTPEYFCGVWDGISEILFDIKGGGTLCSLINLDSSGKKVWNADSSSVFFLEPACTMRFGTGSALPFVLAHILREKFIPNLEWDADYNKEYYDRMFGEHCWDEEIRRTPPGELPGMYRKITTVADECYNRGYEKSVWEYYRKENEKGQWMPWYCAVTDDFSDFLDIDCADTKPVSAPSAHAESTISFAKIFPLFRIHMENPRYYRSDLLRTILSSSGTTDTPCNSLELPKEAADALARLGAETIGQACVLFPEEILAIAGGSHHVLALIRYAAGARIHEGLRRKETDGWYIDWGDIGL